MLQPTQSQSGQKRLKSSRHRGVCRHGPRLSALALQAAEQSRHSARVRECRDCSGLSESIVLDLQLCLQSHAAARAPRRRGCSPGWSAARAHSPTVSGLLRRSTRRPQVVPAWLCAFIRHPQLITCRLIDGTAEWLCWLRRMFPVAARHAARLSMIPGNGLHHWGGTGRALEHRSHYPARPRVRKLDSSRVQPLGLAE